MALPIVDLFTSGSQQALSTYNASWVVEAGGFEVRTNGFCYGTVDSLTSFARRSDETFNAEHISEIVIGSLAGSVYIGAAVGVQTGAASGYYYIVSIGGYNEFGRTVAGSDTIISSAPTQAWASGDVLRVRKEEPDASTVRVTVYHAPAADPTNFTQIYTYDDTSGSRLSGGSPGISAYANSAGTSGIDKVTLDNMVAAAAVDQEGARFGIDDGSESAHSWAQAQDVNDSVAIGTARLIRALINGTGDPASAAFTLRYQKNGAGGYLPVPVGPSVAEAYAQPTWGAVGTAASGTNTANPSYPTGISASTSKLLAVCTGRSDVANAAFTAPAGWTSLGQLEGGTGTFGVDTGTRRVGFFLKDTTTGSETGTTGNFGYTEGGATNSTLRVSVFRIEVPAGYTLDTSFVSGADTSNGTNYSAAASSSVTFDPNRLVLVGVAQNIDTGTLSAVSLTATGVTFGTLTSRASTAVTNGNDHRHILYSAPVSSGTATVAPTFAYTISASGSGPVGFLVLRARLPAVTNEIYVAASANIAAGGEATTARLTPPSGKTTSDFVTGRRWDDENGADAIDITVDDYTEVEWSINTQAPAANGDYFDFRVYAGASALTSYTVTPRLTLGAPAPTISGTSSATPAEGSTLTISGSNFQAAQGAGGVVIGGVAQVETAWSDTSVSVTVSKGTSIKNGVAVNVVLTDNDGGASNAFALTSILPPSGWQYVNIGTPNTTASNRLTASPDIASGDQVEWGNIVGTGSVTVLDDGTFVADVGVAAFDFRVFTTGDGWGSVATQTITSGAVVSVDGSASAVGQAAASRAVVGLATGSAAATAQSRADPVAITSRTASSQATGQSAGASGASASVSGAASSAGQAASAAVAVGMSAGSGGAAVQAAAASTSIASAGGAATAPQQSVASAGAVAAVEAVSAAPQQADANTGGTVFVAVDGAAAAAGQASGAAAATSSVTGAAQAPAQATADTGARVVLAVDGFAAAPQAATATPAATAAVSGAAIGTGQAAAPAKAIAAASAAAQAPQQATGEAGFGAIVVAVDGIAGGLGQAAAGFVAIASASSSSSAASQSSAEIFAAASVSGSAAAPSQASAEAAGRQTIAVDGIAAAPQQASAQEGAEEPVQPPAYGGGGAGRMVTPRFPLPKGKRARRVVAVDGIASATAQASASVQAVFAVAGAAASSARLGTADLPLGAMVADKWLAARMEELDFERYVLEHL